MSLLSRFKVQVVFLCDCSDAQVVVDAMDAMENIIVAIPGLEDIDITYIGSRSRISARQLVNVSLCDANAADQSSTERARVVEQRVASAVRRVMAGLPGRVARNTAAARAA